MKTNACKREVNSSRAIGLVLLPLILVLLVPAMLLVPALGIISAAAMLLVAGIFVAAPQGSACRLDA